MEEKMRKNVTTGLIGLSLILCLIGLLGSSWLTVDYNDEEVEGYISLSEYHIEYDNIEVSMGFSEICDETEDEEACELATAGTVAKVFLWLGVLLTLLMLVMLGAVLLWYVLLPDIGGMDVGMSAYITIIAGLLGLGSTVLEKYEISMTMSRR